jgi:hypothetical protein
MSDLTPAFVGIRTQKAQSEDWAFYLHSVGWLMGLEPTTTGITIQPSNCPFGLLIRHLQI